MTKLKIAFGPKTTANSFYQSGVKVARGLNRDERFEAGTLGEKFVLEELMSYDVLVFIKILPSYEILKKLKDAGKKLILDYHDMFLYPSVYERNPIKKVLKKIYYFKLEATERKRYQLLDYCLVASPAIERVVRGAGIRPVYLFRQIFNDWNQENFKIHNQRTTQLNIIWTGSPLNLKQNKPVELVLRRLCKKYNSKVIYLTQEQGQSDDAFIYKKWSLDTWEQDLLEGDIAFRWWIDSNDQYHKDSNKVISYMAAGLPVVCRPTEADKTVVVDGETGFFVYSPEELGGCIEELIVNPTLRKEVGEKAHREVWSRYHFNEYISKLKKLLSCFVNYKTGK
ncbi:MAG TPA: glycosyltransferase [Candidatus Omnitrophota bacterium]|nr:glycosyltransferase [Candidatus Omnitrophota bacterium]HPD85179.1 glycosyltransferase [Candidatus Omnitrophota bacterium]HRZ04320.1 glycosyltransferase [Candidatus Omnitrophota bacterium]